MNFMTAVFMGAAGMLAGWFIPVISQRISAYKSKKKGEILKNDPRFVSQLIRTVCLVLNGGCWFLDGLFVPNLLHIMLLAVIISDALIIAIIDIRIRIVANETVLIMALAGVIFQISYFGIAELPAAVITMVIVMAVFMTLGSLIGLSSIGAGDVKLAGAMGLVFGWPRIMYALIGMSIVTLVCCCVGLITKKLSIKSMLPFAPFMMTGTILAIVSIIIDF